VPITFTTTGSYSATRARLERMSKSDLSTILNKYGPVGVAALRSVTPVDTGETASRWTYKVYISSGKWQLEWRNENLTDTGVPVVVLLEFGHGTGTGGYVAGKRFIRPAIVPIFAQIISEVRREVARP